MPFSSISVLIKAAFLKGLSFCYKALFKNQLIYCLICINPLESHMDIISCQKIIPNDNTAIKFHRNVDTIIYLTVKPVLLWFHSINRRIAAVLSFTNKSFRNRLPQLHYKCNDNLSNMPYE